MIVVGVFVLGFVGIVVGYHTKAGSEIDLHPSDGLAHGDGQAAPGAEGSGTLSGRDEDGVDPFDARGTQ